MKIETKFDVGQRVMVLYSNKIETGRIERIDVKFENTVYVVYDINISNILPQVSKNEHEVFLTQEDLIKHLLQNNTK